MNLDPITVGLLGLVVLLLLIFLGVHISVALGVVGIGGMCIIFGFDRAITMSASTAFGKISSFSNTAIPFFILMGMLCSSLGASSGMYHALKRFVGRIHGGLGIATVLASAAFGTLNGSGVVTASVFTKASVPSMVEAGYDKEVAYGVVCGSANLGQLIPPSVIAILMGAMTNMSIGTLLIAIIGPGLLIIFANSIYLYILSRLRPDKLPLCKERYTLKEKIFGLKELIPVVVSIAIIVGGMSSGIFSSTESGAIGCIVFLVYALVKRIPFKAILAGFTDSVKSLAMIFILMVSAQIFASFLTVSGVASAMTDVLVNNNIPGWLFLLLTAIILLILGCFMDSSGMMALTVPILFPVAQAMGIEPLQFCLVSIVSMLLGAITPPVGLVCFTASGIAGDDVPLAGIFRGSAPYIAVIAAVIVLLAFFPGLSTILPSIMNV